MAAEKRSLTDREREVLLLICDGLTAREAAAELGVSYKTVEFHRARIMESWDVPNVVMLVRKAIRLGIIEA